MLQINLTGYLGQNAKMESTNNDAKVIAFSVASTEKNKDKNGNLIEKTTWVNCYLYSNSEKLCEVLKKGTQVFVSGKANFAIVLNSTGTNVIRTYLNVDLLDILSVPKLDAAPGTNAVSQSAPPPTSNTENEGVIDDLPF